MGAPLMHATTCARSSADIFLRWYARSSCLSRDFRNDTHFSGVSPMRNRPSFAPLGGRGLGGRQSSACSSGRYAVRSSDPAPVARSNWPFFSFGGFDFAADDTAAVNAARART